MLLFDDVVPRLLAICEAYPRFQEEVTTALVVRDLRGRVRLVLRVERGGTLTVEDLEATLVLRLEGWFAGPVLWDGDSRPARRRLAQELLQASVRDWPHGWPRRIQGLPAEPPVELPERWRAVQAVFSKAAWVLPNRTRAPWPLTSGAPRITAFFSYKGGVGRTTLAAVLALRLARLGRRVVCLDLDLEAPGLGDLLLGRPVTDRDPSALDWLLAHAATGHPGSAPVLGVPVQDRNLLLVPAGALGGTYLEKLARLDLVRQVGDPGSSPVGEALRALLEQVRREHRPDHVFIDCRAGLHDLAGLALNELAHVDVLVGRHSPQDLVGASLVLETLARQRAAADLRLLVVDLQPHAGRPGPDRAPVPPQPRTICR